ncbi:MAG: mucoidy inhibitor MuiA family protein [Bacteroidetes bacterium]|nr:mucoidy inhibitor MuiA family protein [Bacteroidota bacterium]
MKTISVIILWVASLTSIAQTSQPVNSKITDVTVFLNRAQVTRQVKTQLSSGKTELIVGGLTSMLDPESIQVSGRGNFIILGTSHQQNYLSELNMPKSLKSLKDSIEWLQKQISLEQSQKEILNKEEGMLMNNQKIGGANQNLSVIELKSMADFYRSRLSEIVSTRMKEDDKIKKLNERVNKLQQQFNTQNEMYQRNTSEIVISLSADAATNADLEINYVVANAGWTPQYDIRAINTKGPIQLSYKANVFQSTGEEWKNVKLKLSTANPNQSGLKPELVAWYLDFYQPISYVQRGLQGKVAGMQMAKKAEPESEMKMEEPLLAASLAEYVTTVQTSLNTEFDIALPYTVSSASKPTLVDIRNYELKAVYNYSTAPKLDKDAFLLAKAIGWEELSLLPAEANIFFEGTFTGKSFIDPNNIKDTLSLSLGRDKRIVVKREKLKELTSRKFIGTTQKESYAWEISVRNTKSESIRISIEDQIPVSQNSQIEVTATDLAGASYNKDTGKLSWDLKLQPNETKKIVFKYEVKYPKDKQVNGL